MPYEVRRVGLQFCVFKKGTDQRMGCHPTQEKARRQLSALYANEPAAKALMPLKAQVLPDDEEAAFWDGRLPRRLLAIPFGGPIPSAKSDRGVDLDDQFFDERTDIYGPYPALRHTRERLVDFMHSYRPPGRGYGDDTGMMAGHLLGKSILDPDPDEDGWWVDLWLERGNARVSLVKRLAERGAQLFGSSQPIGKARVDPDGHIALWPYWLQTITTAPQNTLSVVRPKAALDSIEQLLRYDTDPWTTIEGALRSLEASPLPSAGRPVDEAKAGRVLSAPNDGDLRSAMDALEAALEKVRGVIARQPDYSSKEQPTSE